jgi:hypothetical protein
LTVKIGEHDFDGPFESTDSIEDKSGVYAVIHQKEGERYLLDVGESSEMKKRLEDHDRKECWKKNSKGAIIEYSVYYTPKLDEKARKEIEAKIRTRYSPPCGKS